MQSSERVVSGDLGMFNFHEKDLNHGIRGGREGGRLRKVEE